LLRHNDITVRVLFLVCNITFSKMTYGYDNEHGKRMVLVVTYI